MTKVWIPACALAVGLSAAVHAQDTVETNKSTVKVDDAHTAVMTGCLMPGPGDTVMLMGAASSVGKDLTTKSRTKTDVDGDDTKIKTESEAKVEDAHKGVGTSGTIASYVVTPRSGVDLRSHVGEQVEIAAVIVDAKKKDGDDDAKVKIEDQSKVDNEHAPDGKAKTTTKLEVPRGSQPALLAVSVKTVAPNCR